MKPCATLILVTLLLALSACAPQLRFKLLTSSGSTNNLTYTIKVDESTWDLAAGGTTEYKPVNVGNSHEVTVTYTVSGKDMSYLVSLFFLPLKSAQFDFSQKYTYDLTSTNNIVVKKD